jgi:hypothetical protein
MDYKAWTQRARTFHEAMRRLPGEIDVTVEVAPTLTESELHEIRAKWTRHLPAELVRFWTEGSAHLNGRYVWTPPEEELGALKEVFEHNCYIYGGPRFIAAAETDPKPLDLSWFDPEGYPGEPEVWQANMDLWGRAILLLGVGNGDYLGLDAEAPGCDPDDPPVVYLVHDEPESGPVCPRFTEFLPVWEELSYIGPESWLLWYWFDESRKSLDPRKHHTDKLRRLLTPR